MGDKWDKAYQQINENWGMRKVSRNRIEEQDAMPQDPMGGGAPSQDQGMGDMNQDQGGGQDQGQDQNRQQGEWNDDLKAKAQEVVSKSLKDLYAGKDAQGQTDLVKNVVGPAVKGELGVQNVPYKELHALLGGSEGGDQGGAQGGSQAPKTGSTTGAPAKGGQQPSGGGDQQMNF